MRLEKYLATLLAFTTLSCSSSPPPIPLRAEEIPIPVRENPVPGTVNQVWAEPMVDQIKVPAQLDKNGIYYRPAHQTLVEIRQEKYQQVEHPKDRDLKDSFSPGGSGSTESFKID